MFIINLYFELIKPIYSIKIVIKNSDYYIYNIKSCLRL